MEIDPEQLNLHYKKYIKDVEYWLPEGIIDVNLIFLHRLNLLKFHSREIEDRPLTRYFQVIESSEKITLVNDQFVVWIVPEKVKNVSITYVFIALNQVQEPHLEMAFSTWGVYNSSRLVLHVLEKLLSEIQETEDFLNVIKKGLTQSS